MVDCAGVLATHLTEVVRENMSELLSYSETVKLLDELPREQQKLVQDLIPSQVSIGLLQRLLQALLAERVSIRDLPTILEGLQEAAAANLRALPQMLGIVRIVPRPAAFRGGARRAGLCAHRDARRMGGGLHRMLNL